MHNLSKSSKLNNVCYDIRGPILQEALRLEEDGHSILKLNIGNPAPFGFNAPDEILKDVIANISEAQGYSASNGLYSARKAIMQDCQLKHIHDVDINDIYLGNGVSELILTATQALLENNDEILIPAPDYPLWTAAVSLAGGKPVHYICDEESSWYPDIADIKAKITDKTRAIVIINPNNPTGSVYPEAVLRQIVELAEAHGLVIFADEIYDRILYDGIIHTPLARLVENTLCITFNGLSKSYRLAGFRSGWMIISGRKDKAQDYIQGLNMLTSMRLCSNVPAQLAVQTALGGYQSIKDLVMPSGRLHQQREIAYKMITDIPGVSCVKPMGGIYLFPKLDPKIYPVKDDEQLVLDLLRREKILLVQGTAFNWQQPDHLRLVFLPYVDELSKAIERFANFLSKVELK